MDIVTLLVGVAIVVGLVGIVVPVLPGSLLIAAAVLVWALDTERTVAWVVFGVVVLLLALGWAATYVIAGRRVSASGVPTSSLLVAGVAGIIGFFAVPVIGLFVFFPLALYLMERRRLGDPVAAKASAGLALRATIQGMLVELALAFTAALVWAVAVLMGVRPG